MHISYSACNLYCGTDAYMLFGEANKIKCFVKDFKALVILSKDIFSMSIIDKISVYSGTET